MLKILTCVLLCMVAGGCSAQPDPAEPSRPNVILMMADDLAYIDLSCYGSERISTPRLDELAGQGLSLTQYHAGNPVCSPSRMALMSGAYPARLGWDWGVSGYGIAMNMGMSEDVYTMAEAYGDAGYRTAISGKWHLGQRNMAPENQGFDSAYYIFMSNNQNRDMHRDGEMIQAGFNNRLLTQAFTEEAIRVINQESDQPFFLYLPWTAPHFPAEAHPDWQGNSEIGEYGDVVEELDFRVGQILDALEDRGLAEDTIVIFTSDNGRQPGQNNNLTGPMSGRKWQSREGGTRVPCIIRYPGVVSADTTSDALTAAIDWYPTLAEACGVEIDLPDNAQRIDGVSVWDTLTYEHDGTGLPRGLHDRQTLLYWHGKGPATAIRVGDWKLFFNAGALNDNLQDPDVSDGPVLYNLSNDPMETTDVSDQHPENVERMLLLAQELLTDVYANQVPLGTFPGVDAPEPIQAEEVWGRWID